ncbi:MAG: hypothetical protein QF927_03535 [Verrucomicrobiota bacterium]|nr:hypothetical protein [Verrucomicrobiota bacterium]
MKAIVVGFILSFGMVTGSAESVSEPQADAVPLAKSESVQLEFETESGLAYQVFSKSGDGDWQPLGQIIEGDGREATVSYPGKSEGVAFRVETYEVAGPPSLPEGIDYKLTGIYRLRGAYRVCVAKVDRTAEPARTAHFTLVEGDDGGSLRLVSIDAAAGRVRIEAGGVPLALSLSGNSFQTATAKPASTPQPVAGKPTVITAPPKGKVYMANREPYYKAAQKKKPPTNRYSLLEKSTVKAINRSIRTRPQTIFTPRVSVPGYRVPNYYRPSPRNTKFHIRRR